MKLLAPTPGARSLIKAMVANKEAGAQGASAALRKKQEDDEKIRKLEKSQKLAGVKSASQLLFEHKKELAGERRRQILHEKQMANFSPSGVPQLGRGFGSGASIDLSSPGGPKSALDPAKAKALLALKAKGKSIEKTDPNSVRAKKRKAEEVAKSREKVAKALEIASPQS